MNFKFSLIAALIFSVAISAVALAANSVTLVNKTGRDIEAIYISPVAEDEWERYYGGNDDFENGDSMRISVSSGSKFCDIRCKYTNGQKDTWYGVDMTSKKVILKRNGNFEISGSSSRHDDDDDDDDYYEKRY